MAFKANIFWLIMAFNMVSDSLVISDDPEKIPVILRVRNPPPETLPCPDATDIFPCVCDSYSDYVMDMDCSKVSDSEELSNIFHKPIPFKDFRILRIEGNHHLLSLEDGDFGDATFQNIMFDECMLEDIYRGTFSKSISTLMTISIAENRISEFPLNEMALYNSLTVLNLSFNNLRNITDLKSDSLSTLQLDGNPIEKIPFDFFNYLPNLKEIKLASCSLSSIEPDTFKGLRNLTYLALNNNRLSSVPESAIELYGDHTFLYLHNNSLSSVVPGAIKGVTEVITLQNNQLVELPEEVWRPVMENVKHFHVYGNPLLCGCDIAWLILEPEFMKKLDGSETCFDGEKLVDLDPLMYVDLC